MIISLIALLRQFSQASEQLKTPAPGQFLQHWAQEVKAPQQLLLLLDLDDTSITSPEGQWLGRSDMFYYLLDREMATHPDKSKQEVAERIDPLLVEVYRRVPVIPTDNKLPAIVEQLKSKGVTVLGFTARGRGINEVTLEQLDKTGIHFTDTGPSRFLPIDDKRSFRMERGVVFVSHGNRKGETLVSLLKKGVLAKPARVMLIDDRQRHLDDMAQALSGYDARIDFQPVLCSYLEGKKPFAAQESERQLLDFLYQWRKDEVIGSVIRNDLFTQDFIKRCKQLPKTGGQSCQALRSMLLR